MPKMPQNVVGPHQGMDYQAAGVALEDAKAAMILVHGRGASALSILSLAEEFERNDFAYVAPQAASNTWYPYSFLENIQNNQPGLDSALQVLADLVKEVEDAGIPTEKLIIGGFSQGACLAMEFVALNARRYGGAFAFSGGLIGPPGSPRDYDGSLEGTPVFLGCSNIDMHIPEERVHETAEVMKKLGGEVTTVIYPNMGHGVNFDEIEHVQKMMAAVL